MPRWLLTALVALLVVAMLLLWRRHDPTPLPVAAASLPDPTVTADAGATSPSPSAADAVETMSSAERADGTPAPVEASPFRVQGIVLADRRRPQLGDLHVVAYRGEATDSAALVMQGLDGNGAAPAFVLRGGTIARAAVDNLGNFDLRAPVRHLRLTIEHDLYTMPMPELVHVPRDGTATNVVLAPILGGCIRGKLYGERARQITGVRATLEPDPMSAIRDMRAFFGAMASMGRLRVEPDTDLAFTFAGLIPDAAIVLMAEGDKAFALAPQPALVPGETREVALAVQNAAALRVTVKDETGAGVANAMVAVRTVDGQPSMFPQLRNRHQQTQADGTCLISSIEPTRVFVEASAAGYVAADATIDLDARSEPRELELLLREGGVVTGTVTSSAGELLAGARVAHHPSADIPLFGDMVEQLGPGHLAVVAAGGVTTDAEGRYRLTGLADDGEFLVIAAHPGHAAAFTKGVRMGDTDVEVKLAELGSIRGRVVADEDDTPITRFKVSVVKTMFLLLRAPVEQRAVESADGTFVLTGIPPGDYAIEIEAEGRSTETTDVRCANGTVDIGTIRTTRAAIVSGVVQDEDGVPIRGALVRRRQGALADNPMMAMFSGSVTNTRTDGEGRFTLGPLPAKRLQLLASAEGYASGRSARLELEAGKAIEGVVITLGHGGSITGRLSPGLGNRVQDFVLMAQHQQTQISFGADLAEDGTFRFDNLDPGPYVVQAMPNGIFASFGMQDFRPGRGINLGEMMQKVSSSIVSQRCTVRAGETSEVKLDAGDMVVGTRWTIRVEVGGKPLAGGMLEATSASGRLRATIFSGGEATIGNVEPGAHRIRIRSGLTLAPVGSPMSLVFPADTIEHSSTISLPGGELRGRVLEAASGKPLQAALVRLINEQVADQEDLFGMVLTDAAGEFAFPGLADGTYGVVASEHLGQRDGAAAQRGIRVDASTTNDPIVLRTVPAATASVVVTSAGGLPLVGATVLCVDGDGEPLGALSLATTDGSGRAWFGGMPRGTARVVGRAPGLAPGATDVRDIDATGPTEFRLTLAGGARTTVHAVDGAGSPLAGATLTARCNDGPWLPAMLLIEHSGNGSYELGRLAAGAWDFRISHPRIGTVTQRRVIGNEPVVTVVVAPQ